MTEPTQPQIRPDLIEILEHITKLRNTIQQQPNDITVNNMINSAIEAYIKGSLEKLVELIAAADQKNQDIEDYANAALKAYDKPEEREEPHDQHLGCSAKAEPKATTSGSPKKSQDKEARAIYINGELAFFVDDDDACSDKESLEDNDKNRHFYGPMVDTHTHPKDVINTNKLQDPKCKPIYENGQLEGYECYECDDDACSGKEWLEILEKQSCETEYLTGQNYPLEPTLRCFYPKGQTDD